MRVVFTFLGLLFATAASGATLIDRERFSLVLPDGWVEWHPKSAIVVTHEDHPGELPRKYPMFFASSKECSFILSLIPQSPQVSVESQSAQMIASSRRISTVAKEIVLRAMGGREGFGYDYVSHHKYPVVSVVRVFAFQSGGYVCTIRASTSDAEEDRAAKRMAKGAPAIENIVRSIVIKSHASPSAAPLAHQ